MNDSEFRLSAEISSYLEWEQLPVGRDFARHLRKNMTEAERRLWHHLKLRQSDGKKFRKQAPIGDYVVDFACFGSRLIIELDGSQHASQVDRDDVRTAWLESRGFRVMRFWNFQVFEELDSVLEAIWNALHDPDIPGLHHQGDGQSSVDDLDLPW